MDKNQPYLLTHDNSYSFTCRRNIKLISNLNNISVRNDGEINFNWWFSRWRPRQFDFVRLALNGRMSERKGRTSQHQQQHHITLLHTGLTVACIFFKCSSRIQIVYDVFQKIDRRRLTRQHHGGTGEEEISYTFCARLERS